MHSPVCIQLVGGWRDRTVSDISWHDQSEVCNQISLNLILEEVVFDTHEASNKNLPVFEGIDNIREIDSSLRSTATLVFPKTIFDVCSLFYTVGVIVRYQSSMSRVFS